MIVESSHEIVPIYRRALYTTLPPTATPPLPFSRRPPRHLLQSLLQHAAHVRPDFVGLAAGELPQHAELAVEVDNGSGRGLVHLEPLPDSLRRVVMSLDQTFSRDVIGELAANVTEESARSGGNGGSRARQAFFSSNESQTGTDISIMTPIMILFCPSGIGNKS